MKKIIVVPVLLYLTLAGCFLPPDVETDPRKYSATLEKWRPSGLVNHFPESISESAKNVRFSTFPGFLQGGAWIQLRLELPIDELQKIHDHAAARAKQYHDGGSKFALVNERREDGLASTSFYTSDTLPEGHLWVEFPEDYRLFIFFSEASPEAGPTWDKGRSKGIAVSVQRHEVVYWADNW